MARNTRAVALRRSSLLATSVFASTMLASIGGFAINVATPVAEALAANACSGTSTVVCNGNTVAASDYTFTTTYYSPANFSSISLGPTTAYASNNTVVITPSATSGPFTFTLGSAGAGSTLSPSSGDGIDYNGGAVNQVNTFNINGNISTGNAATANGMNIQTSGATSGTTINVGGNITAGGTGIIGNAAGASDFNVTITGNGSIWGAGGNTSNGNATLDGIALNSAGGNLTVSGGSASPGSIVGGVGILANTTGNGNIKITGSEQILGTAGAAISANINSGNGTTTGSIDIGNSSVGITGGANGIKSNAGPAISATDSSTGHINVYTGAGNITGTNGQGIYANSTGHGVVTVGTFESIVSGNTGIVATSSGNGTVDLVQGFNSTITGTVGDGANLTVGANGTINVGNSTSDPFTGNLSGAINGLHAAGGNNVTINVSVGNQSISGTAGSGILATAGNASGIHVDANGTIISGAGGNNAGITVFENSTSGSAAPGNITVNLTGGSEAGGTGVSVTGYRGTTMTVTGTNVNVTGNSSTGSGIYVSSDFTGGLDGTGAIVVGNGSGNPLTGNVSGGTGIYASGGGLVTVNTGAGNVTGFSGDGIDVHSHITLTSLGGGKDSYGGDGTNVTGAGTGVSVTTQGNHTATVSYANGTIDAGGDGIDATATGVFGSRGGDVTVTVGGAGTNINARGENGIYADGSGNLAGAGGNVVVNTGQGSTIGGNVSDNLSYGIQAVSNNGGNVAVNSGSDIGQTLSGGLGVYDAGIHAETSGSGNVDVNSNGTINSRYDGIEAFSVNGNVTVGTGKGNISGVGVVNAAGYAGVWAQATGNGSVTVVTNDGNTIGAASGDGNSTNHLQYGIIAEVDGASGGPVSVTTGTGQIGATPGVGNQTGGVSQAGIWASITSATNTNTVNVTNNANITVAGTSGNVSYGIYAVSAGNGTVTVNNTANIDPATIGIFSSGAGDVVVNNNSTNQGDVTGNTGISAISVASTPATLGAVTVTINGGNITGTGSGPSAQIAVPHISANFETDTGDGVDAVSGSGAPVKVLVQPLDGSDPGPALSIIGAKNGIFAEGEGLVNVTVVAPADGQNIITGQTGYGIGAIGLGDLQPGLYSTSVEVGGSIVTGQAGGIYAEGSGQVEVTTHVGTDVGSSEGNGITAITHANNLSGDVLVNDDGEIGSAAAGGPVGGSGIFAENTSGMGTGDVTANAHGNISAQGYGVEVLNYGSGVAHTDVAANRTINADEGGILNLSNASADGSGGPSSNVTVGQGVSILSQAPGGSDKFGIVAANTHNTGTGSVKITADPNLTINVDGAESVGILGATSDPTGFFGSFSGTGNVTITTGTGTITVADTGNSSASTFESAGIAGFSGGGAVNITTDAVISVSSAHDYQYTVGVDAETTGSGVVNVTTTHDITSNEGDGIDAYSGSGTITLVNVPRSKIIGQGNSTATGVWAESGNGAINIGNSSVAYGADITGTYDGIYASTGGNGTITSYVSGNVSGTGHDGIDQHTAAGNNTLVVSGNGTITGDAGIHQVSWNGGDVNTTVLAGHDIETVAGGSGIVDAASSGNITVVDNGTIGNVTPVGGQGIRTVIWQNGAAGNITVTTGANATINSEGDGIYARNSGTGNVIITTNAAVTSHTTGNQGIHAEAHHSGSANTTVNANVSGGEGIYSSTWNGLNTVTVAGNGTTVTGTFGDGIHAVSNNDGWIQVTTGNLTDVQAYYTGIYAHAHDGQVVVEMDGSIGGNGTYAGAGIDAEITHHSSDNGVYVTTGNGSFIGAYDDGIAARNLGHGNVSVTTGVGSEIVSYYDDGIHTFARRGNIGIISADHGHKKRVAPFRNNDRS